MVLDLQCLLEAWEAQPKILHYGLVGPEEPLEAGVMTCQTVRWAAETVDTRQIPTIPVGVILNPGNRTLPVVAFGPTMALQQQVGEDLLVIPSADPTLVVEYDLVLAGVPMKIRLWIKEILEDGRPV